MSWPREVGSEAIYAQADGSRAKDDASAWDQFASDASTTGFCTSWLAILCSQVEHVNGALLVLGPDAGGAYSAAAVWPDPGRNMQYLGAAAERALTERRGFVENVLKERRRVAHRVSAERRRAAPARDGGQKASLVAYPIEVAGRVHGAVILDIVHSPAPKLQHALRLVHWGSAWLVDRFRQQLLGEQHAASLRLVIASEVIATALQEPRLGACALAVANELAGRLGCERVGLGLEKRSSIVLAAISHSAAFDARSDLVRLLVEAMDEVLDLDMAIIHPPQDNEAVGALAHAALSRARGEAAVLSVPLVNDGSVIGAMTFERSRERPFDSAELELCKTLGLLLGPVLELKLMAERGLRERTMSGVREGAALLFGPRHPGFKLGALVALAVVLVLCVADGDYRVTTKTVIEGAVQRAMVAPFQGYVAESLVRAGDNVKAGQPLARLEERELRLERTRWASEAEQAHRKYRQAAALQERAAMAVVAAQGDQAEAQLALVEERLARATLKAPFDGVVVTGDLSQLLGSPVEQGKVLFEVAPLDAYRVVLNVDERDIAQVRRGQRGELALSGMPSERLAFTVRQVTPVSTPQDGRNYFRVEAQLDQASVRLRPGMEGIGKVDGGQRKLIWIWTHNLVDWLRLWTWKWLW
ncbi:MAG: efflux RND transporter periplasmic adaptor subunit [Pseudomonadota bacterium]